MAIKKDTKDAREKVVAKPDSTAADASLNRLKSALELRRKSQQPDDAGEGPTIPPPVSLGPSGAIVDALLNTAPEHMLELTDFNRNQVTLIPQVVVTDDMWDYVEQLLSYRNDKDYFLKTFKRKYPEIPNLSRRFVYVLAQTSRSRDGKLKKALEDMALAELETKSMEEGAGLGGRDFED